MISLILISAAAGIAGISGMLCLLLPRMSRDRFFAASMILSGAIGTAASLFVLVNGQTLSFESRWLLPIGRFAVRLDSLSAFFLVPVFLVPSLATLFGSSYWKEDEHRSSAAVLRIALGLLTAGMAGVLLAQDGVLLLIAWEIMALSAFFAIAAGGATAEVRSAAWVYLVATHVGTLSLVACFTLLSAVTGSADLVPLAPGVGTARELSWLFVLGLVGFGLKAGTMPLHVWLPGAHANAPSHVSAVLSGVMLKIGVYGLIRICWMLPSESLWRSWLLIGLGAASAVLALLFALGQRDYKRLLAYSSIENIGILVMGLGLAHLGQATGRSILTFFGLTGALLHVWNHALFKSLLFFIAGTTLHAVGTRRLNALGGLGKRMPKTAVVAAIACLSAAALPPLNGFVSEWLLYRAILGDWTASPGGAGLSLAVAVLAIALAGALAILVFLRFFGTAFLGQERTASAAAAHDPSREMLAPMMILSALCLGIGLLPAGALWMAARATSFWIGSAALDGLAGAAPSLWTMSAIGISGLALAAALFALLRIPARSAVARPGSWGCGYARPSARMQYGESSLAQSLLGLVRGIVLQRRKLPSLAGPFPGVSAFESDTPDVVLDRAMLPAFDWVARGLTRFRQMHRGRGRVQIQILYLVVGLLVLLALAWRGEG